MRILVVDDHPILRQALAALLREEPDIEIAGEASDGEMAIVRTRELRPDAILMDVQMPGMDGIQATRAIHGEFPDACIVALSAFEDGDTMTRMRDAGAYSYVVKGDSMDSCLQALRDCVRIVHNRPPADRRAAA